MRISARLRAATRRLGGDRAVSRDGVRFSVVLPIYNSPIDHLDTQLHAIAAQTHDNWECIVIDDGSTDTRGVELAEAMARRDHRFSVRRRPRNGGIAAATNDALDCATGDWIVFCDHDDMLYAPALATIAAHVAAHPEDDIVYTDEELIDGAGAVIHPYRKPDYSPERLLANNYMCHVVTVRRQLVDEVGHLVGDFEPAADRDFNFRATHAARHVGHVPQILYGWRAIPGSVAMAITEKPNVEASQLSTAQAHLTRINERAVASIRPGGEAMVRIEWPPTDDPVTTIAIDPSTTLDELREMFDDSTARFVAFEPLGAEHDERWPSALTAQCARDTVGACGPLLVTADDRLLSAGRTHHPVVDDVLQGTSADDPGPFGAFLASREAASVSPLGAVFDRAAVEAIGGFDIGAVIAGCNGSSWRFDGIAEASVSIDLTVAVVCTALRLSGVSTIWTPNSMITLAASNLPTDHDRQHVLSQRAILQRSIAAVLPEIDEDNYSPLGVHRIPARAHR